MKNFIIRTDDSIEGYGFEMTVSDLFNSISLPTANEYIVNWTDSDIEIVIDSIEADGVIVWEGSSIDIDDWTENDDNLVEGLISYIEDHIAYN
jgi:hypothetical protein|tara:strand:- start:372 stop:650 length:279 start_codon:yes stop_codon:yes gene_type:complete